MCKTFWNIELLLVLSPDRVTPNHFFISLGIRAIHCHIKYGSAHCTYQFCLEDTASGNEVLVKRPLQTWTGYPEQTSFQTSLLKIVLIISFHEIASFILKYSRPRLHKSPSISHVVTLIFPIMIFSFYCFLLTLVLCLSIITYRSYIFHIHLEILPRYQQVCNCLSPLNTAVHRLDFKENSTLQTTAASQATVLQPQATTAKIRRITYIRLLS